MLQKLPTGLQSFKKIREENLLYVDKTKQIYNLIKWADYNFLARPRRFGKSLTVDTIAWLYRGQKDLFQGLWIEDEWDWENKHPVIKISFGSWGRTVEDLRDTFNFILRNNNSDNSPFTVKTPSNQLSELVIQLFEKNNQKVVVLIDEYDKPILDSIDDLPKATEVREELKDFYGVLKDLDQYLELVFITGVSKFSKVSLFSGLNNLKDLSLNPNFGDICGYTEVEVKEYFAEYLNPSTSSGFEKVDFSKLQRWYNGFNFLWAEKVFNPYDILNFFDLYEYKNYWFETATPTFLIKMIQKNHYYVPDIENLEVGSEIMESFDIEKLSLETLLFQAGYLTIKSQRQIGWQYSYLLQYPNLEIKMSLTNSILSWLVEDRVQKTRNQASLFRTLEAGKVAEFEGVVKQIFASIPYNWFVQNKMAEYEGYYCSVIYTYFYGLGMDIISEDVTNKGRIDLTLKLNNRVFIFEFKTEKNNKGAMEQIKERKYWEKYQDWKQEIYLIGMEFDEKKRELVKYEWEMM